ncbi:MAG: gluconokinase [Verrucomicrobiota bacterium]
MANSIILVMGVSGCGKSSVGARLAERLNGKYIEGDELHPESNIEKMSRGEPLTDSDRWPWFDKIIQAGQNGISHQNVVFSSSALKRIYRDYLREAFPDLVTVYLEGDFELIHSRMEAREHFMPPALLKSQFDALEAPVDDPNTLHISVLHSVDSICDKAVGWIDQHNEP